MEVLISETENALLQFVLQLKKNKKILEEDYQRFIYYLKMPGGIYNLVMRIVKPIKTEGGKLACMIHHLQIPHYFTTLQKRVFLDLLIQCYKEYKSEKENAKFIMYYQLQAKKYLNYLEGRIFDEICRNQLRRFLPYSDAKWLADKKALTQYSDILSQYPKIKDAIKKYEIVQQAKNYLWALDIQNDFGGAANNKLKPLTSYQKIYQFRLHLKKNENSLRLKRDNHLETFLKVVGLVALSLLTIGIGAYPFYHTFFGNWSTQGLRLLKNVAHERKIQMV